MEEISIEELFIYLPKLCLFKDSRSILRKMEKFTLTAKEIFKIIGLHKESSRSYAMLEKWCLPKYLFLKRIESSPYRYEILDKNIWDFIYKKERGCSASINFFNFIRTKVTIIE